MGLCEITLADDSLKRIHVFGQRLRQSKKDGMVRAFYIVKHKGKTYHCVSWNAEGVSGRQSLGGMPGCRHAVAWLETRAPLTMVMLEEQSQ